MGHLWLRCQALFALLSDAATQPPQFVEVSQELFVAAAPPLTVR